MSNMTRSISPEFPRNLRQLDANLLSTDVLTKVDDIHTTKELQFSQPQERSVDVAVTGLIDDLRSGYDDSNTDDEEQTSDVPSSVFTEAQTKRAQNAVFEEFIREKDESELRQSLQDVENFIQVKDALDTRDTFSAGRIIDRVRDYQSELFARAKAGNIIAVLDTGSGKTLIAALLLRDIVDKEMEDRASGNPPRTSFFLVGTWLPLT
jgi:hypothetical protein